MTQNPGFGSEMNNSRIRQIFSGLLITFVLILVNLAIYLFMLITGDPSDGEYMLNHGANFYPLSLHGEAWRLFTSMFLHFSASHIFNNMLSLYAIGSVIERAFGKLRYSIIYLISGLAGSLVSALYHQAIGQPVVSAGASGAIFGLSGALVCLALFHQTERYGISSKRVPMAILISVVLSSLGSSDGACHIGGLIAGFLTSLFMIFVWKKRIESELSQ